MASKSKSCGNLRTEADPKSPRDAARNAPCATAYTTRGTRDIVGEALPQNRRIIGLVRKLGFEVKAADDEGVCKFRLPLQ